jgi:hypothetical protein
LLSAALVAMLVIGLLSPGAASAATGTVEAAVTMEKFVLGQGYIIEPILVRVPQGTPVSKAVTDLLAKKFGARPQPWTMTGTITDTFYLASVRDSDSGISGIPPYIMDVVQAQSETGNIGTRTNPNWLKEFDYTNASGWMFCVNSGFPGVSAANVMLQDGDVARWQFTLVGNGADLDANGSWGGPTLKPLANKDALTWRVAEINTYENRSAYGAAYDSALAALMKIDSSQAEVDAARAGLGERVVNPPAAFTPAPMQTPPVVAQEPAPAPANVSVAKVATVSVKAGKGKLTLSWKAASNAKNITGYQIRYRVKGAAKWTTKTISANRTSYTIGNLKKGKAYQIQVRAYKKASKKNYYGGWSATKSGKTKK